LKGNSPPNRWGDIKIGELLKLGNRTIHLIIRLSVLDTENSFLGAWAYPIALLVIEPGKEYAVSFSEEKITLAQLMDIAPSMRDILDKARGIHRIKVS
jgi:hypothetical protein